MSGPAPEPDPNIEPEPGSGPDAERERALEPVREPPARPADRPRRLPQTLGGSLFLLVVAVAGTGIGIVVAGPWRTGIRWLGVALLLGACGRAVLSERGAGMLRVRRRWSDVLTLVVAGSALLVLAVLVPERPR